MSEVESISKTDTDLTKEDSSVSDIQNDVLTSTDKENYKETEKDQASTDEMTNGPNEKPEKGTNIGLAPPPPTNPWTRHLKQSAENGTLLWSIFSENSNQFFSNSVVHLFHTAEQEEPALPKPNSKRKTKVRLLCTYYNSSTFIL